MKRQILIFICILIFAFSNLATACWTEEAYDIKQQIQDSDRLVYGVVGSTAPYANNNFADYELVEITVEGWIINENKSYDPEIIKIRNDPTISTSPTFKKDEMVILMLQDVDIASNIFDVTYGEPGKYSPSDYERIIQEGLLPLEYDLYGGRFPEYIPVNKTDIIETVKKKNNYHTFRGSVYWNENDCNCFFTEDRKLELPYNLEKYWDTGLLQGYTFTHKNMMNGESKNGYIEVLLNNEMVDPDNEYVVDEFYEEFKHTCGKSGAKEPLVVFLLTDPVVIYDSQNIGENRWKSRETQVVTIRSEIMTEKDFGEYWTTANCSTINWNPYTCFPWIESNYYKNQPNLYCLQQKIPENKSLEL